jgi:3'-phosphoadenosine 5'-phosphosulfate sulfotransferase (PAPS reductase)/FAD synthetase
MSYPIALTPEIESLLAAGSPVAIGVSGGKDSCAVAFATIEYLDSIGHTGPRVLIHSDLGRVEWKASLPTCERLAEILGLELIVVRREAGDMMDRWLTRWRNNVARYVNLECVKLILPWSTPSMRFCTSELKVAVICRELIKRFPGQTIVSVSGIRREESARRAKAPIVQEQKKLASKTHKTTGIDWHPILDWKIEDVFSYLKARDFPLHEAYTAYGSSRVSCAFCILGSQSDFKASASCPDNQDIYREMVQLEAASSFGFQDAKWLADTAPELLDESTRKTVTEAKEKGRQRQTLEARIPKHLLYVKGWPVFVPTWDEAETMAEVRREVGNLLGLDVGYTTPGAIIDRHQELMFKQDSKRRAA